MPVRKNEKVLAGERIKHFFTHTDMEAQRRHQAAFLTYALGGAPDYSGRSMERAREGLNLQSQHWDAVVEDLGATLTELGASGADIGEVVERLEPLKEPILGK